MSAQRKGVNRRQQNPQLPGEILYRQPSCTKKTVRIFPRGGISDHVTLDLPNGFTPFIFFMSTTITKPAKIKDVLIKCVVKNLTQMLSFSVQYVHALITFSDTMLIFKLQIFTSCVCLWTAKVRAWQNPFPQVTHLKGFSFEWIYLNQIKYYLSIHIIVTLKLKF